MPWAGHIGLFGVMTKIVANPSFEEYLEMLAYGERHTWPILHAVRSHCIVEASLEKCVQVRRHGLITSMWPVLTCRVVTAEAA